MPKINRLANQSDFLIVKNKLSQKPKNETKKLINYLNDNYNGGVADSFHRFELRQNYSNDTVEISKMFFDYNSWKFISIAQKTIPATSGSGQYINAVKELQKMDSSIKPQETIKDKILKFVCKFFD